MCTFKFYTKHKLIQHMSLHINKNLHQ
jgi:hypothetical protein